GSRRAVGRRARPPQRPERDRTAEPGAAEAARPVDPHERPLDQAVADLGPMAVERAERGVLRLRTARPQDLEDARGRALETRQTPRRRPPDVHGLVLE